LPIYTNAAKSAQACRSEILSRSGLLPPEKVMLDFLSTKGKQFLPRTYGRLRLTRTSVRARRGRKS
jgi:hypothetical protein